MSEEDKPVKRCMIDIETLGTANDAVIIQIGAVIFDENGMMETFESRMNVGSQENRSATASTLAFWFRQEVSLYDIIGDEDLEEGLRGLKKFIKGKRIDEFWSKGSFDFNLLENAYESYDIKLPWQFWMLREFRTVFKLPIERDMPKNKELHNAMADAVHQAEELNLIYKKVNAL
jgi:hypothetical protein